MTGAPLADDMGGGIGSGACDRLLVAEFQDMEERPELTDHREAWPEDPELVDETDILVRCEYGNEGGMKTPPLSASLTVINCLSETWPGVCVVVQGALVVSGIGSFLTSMCEPVGVDVDEAPLGEVDELEDEFIVPWFERSDGEGAGGGGGGPWG